EVDREGRAGRHAFSTLAADAAVEASVGAEPRFGLARAVLVFRERGDPLGDRAALRLDRFPGRDMVASLGDDLRSVGNRQSLVEPDPFEALPAKLSVDVVRGPLALSDRRDDHRRPGDRVA